MATRRKTVWKLDERGQYARQVGWKLSPAGKRVQHKFRLGSQLREAELRELKLRTLWESVERSCAPADALWTETTLEMAKTIARGDTFALLPKLAGEGDEAYASRIRKVQQEHAAALRACPADEVAFARGSGVALTTLMTGLIFPPSPAEEYRRQLEASFVPTAPPMIEFTRRDPIPKVVYAASSSSRSEGGTLHEAMNAYVAWIEQEYFDEGLGRLTDNGRTKVREVSTLQGRHGDVPLAELGFEEVRTMFSYWRRRPRKKTKTGPGARITVKSAQNYIGELKRFFAWLHTSQQFAWRRPEDFYEIDFKVPADPGERQRGLVQNQVFSLEELRLLNKYATPEERLYLLLGLNCGFGMKEIATLEIGEVRLREAHSPEHAELLGFETTAADSFIKRVRRKNAVYGEWILFPQTVQMLEWALQKRRRRTGVGNNAPLLLNGAGKPLDTPTTSGNRNQQIPGAFDRLLKRIRRDGGQIRAFSFGKLRKTAGDLIRRFADGEVAGVFLCHGRAVATDDLADVYTNRPYGKCFRAIRQVEAHLASVFAEAPIEPTKPISKSKLSVIERIVAARQEGKTVRQIASALKLPGATVYGYLRRLEKTAAMSAPVPES